MPGAPGAGVVLEWQRRHELPRCGDAGIGRSRKMGAPGHADFRAAWKPTVPASTGRPTTSEKPSPESAPESSATE